MSKRSSTSASLNPDSQMHESPGGEPSGLCATPEVSYWGRCRNPIRGAPDFTLYSPNRLTRICTGSVYPTSFPPSGFPGFVSSAKALLPPGPFEPNTAFTRSHPPSCPVEHGSTSFPPPNEVGFSHLPKRLATEIDKADVDFTAPRQHPRCPSPPSARRAHLPARPRGRRRR